MLAHRVSMRPTSVRVLIKDVGPVGPIYTHNTIHAFEVRLSGLHLSGSRCPGEGRCSCAWLLALRIL